METSDKKTEYEKTNDIHKLYETEEVPTEKKIIYQKWKIPQIGFYWLIAELDKSENIAKRQNCHQK